MEQELSARMAGVEEKVTALSRRTERLEKGQTALNRLATAVEVLATKQESMGQSLERLNEKMDSLERRPGQRWESLADKVLLVLAGAFVSFLLAGGAA